MNKAEWKLHYRIVRADRPKSVITQGQMLAVLKELYEYDYTEKEYVFIRLVTRYTDKLDKSYATRCESFKPAAKERMKNLWKNLVYGNNPFMAMIPKSDFSGVYTPVPLDYSDAE